MSGNKKALAKAYVAIKHVLGTASSMLSKWNKDELIVKLWAAQCTECDSERMEAEYDDADDAAGSDTSSRQPDLVENPSSNGSGSDGISEAEDVEELVQAPAPTAAPARRPHKARAARQDKVARAAGAAGRQGN
jgi:hypothetical protein